MSCGSVVGSWLLDLTADVLRVIVELSRFDGGVSDLVQADIHAAVDLGVPAIRYIYCPFERFGSRRLGAYANKILNGMRQCLEVMMFANVLLWISIPFVSTIYFGIR